MYDMELQSALPYQGLGGTIYCLVIAIFDITKVIFYNITMFRVWDISRFNFKELGFLWYKKYATNELSE